MSYVDGYMVDNYRVYMYKKDIFLMLYLKIIFFLKKPFFLDRLINSRLELLYNLDNFKMGALWLPLTGTPHEP